VIIVAKARLFQSSVGQALLTVEVLPWHLYRLVRYVDILQCLVPRGRDTLEAGIRSRH
jgi:hypothetical protein